MACFCGIWILSPLINESGISKTVDRVKTLWIRVCLERERERERERKKERWRERERDIN